MNDKDKGGIETDPTAIVGGAIATTLAGAVVSIFFDKGGLPDQLSQIEILERRMDLLERLANRKHSSDEITTATNLEIQRWETDVIHFLMNYRAKQNFTLLIDGFHYLPWHEMSAMRKAFFPPRPRTWSGWIPIIAHRICAGGLLFVVGTALYFAIGPDEFSWESGMEVFVVLAIAYLPVSYWVMRKYKRWHHKAQEATEKALNARIFKRATTPDEEPQGG
ncbi:hypothetical protein [uncultured Tateyamaria sp.]|uniref:hypothetical protein n=1 Tax=uncultured Tateyamaria sp. TaxID=455651 RepID=UPI002612F480|nr:hypothetical protein [uncultured Tateyamaria sp.]